MYNIYFCCIHTLEIYITFYPEWWAGILLYTLSDIYQNVVIHIIMMLLYQHQFNINLILWRVNGKNLLKGGWAKCYFNQSHC